MDMYTNIISLLSIFCFPVLLSHANKRYHQPPDKCSAIDNHTHHRRLVLRGPNTLHTA